MKKLLIIFLLFANFIAIAQTEEEFIEGNFVIKTVEYGNWSESNNEWIMGTVTPYESLFTVTSNMVKQVNPNENWTYYIKEGPIYNETHDHFVFLIIDGTGEEYLMIVDFTNRNIRFIYEKGQNISGISRFTFTSFFTK